VLCFCVVVVVVVGMGGCLSLCLSFKINSTVKLNHAFSIFFSHTELKKNSNRHLIASLAFVIQQKEMPTTCSENK